MRLIEIAAIGQNRELGKNNQMIWHLPADLKFFRNETAGHAIVMGRKTFESLPKMLPGRHHIVISKTMAPLEDVEIFQDPEQFFRAYEQRDEDVFVIGGGQLY
ncbi:dihydrofolate reductase, partial [uncultured Dubosiella sp.]